jgi:DNA-binding transcriptional MocR family regulator
MSRTNQRKIGSTLPLELRRALDGWESGKGPLYQRLATALASAVERQELLAGTRLPPERLLAAQLNIGRSTVGAAYKLLHTRGLVDRRQGRGTQILSCDGVLAGGRPGELATSLQRNLLFRHLGESSDETVDLLGSCSPPSAPVRQAIAAAIAAIDLDELARDHGYLPLGYPPLRRAVAAHLGALGLPSAEEEVLITGGAQQAISLIATCYLMPGQVVVVEDPTFPGAIDAFRTVGARIFTVPAGHSGPDVDLLAATITHNAVQAVYLMPTFHNPTGALMPESARRELARLSRTARVPIIEDDTLAELALGHEAPPPIAALARDAPIVSIGSLSKLFWGGLRVGWIRGPRSMIAQLGRIKAILDLGTSLLSQAVAAALLVEAERIRELRRRELAARLALLRELLERLLPSWRWREPAGGVSLWARLPFGSSTELAQLASRHRVLIVPGTVMSAIGGLDEFVRLPFDHERNVLEEGMRRLARAWEDYSATVEEQAARRLDIVV